MSAEVRCHIPAKIDLAKAVERATRRASGGKRGTSGCPKPSDRR